MREQRRGRPPWEDDSFDVVTGFTAFHGQNRRSP
jgi:hypothetical protein